MKKFLCSVLLLCFMRYGSYAQDFVSQPPAKLSPLTQQYLYNTQHLANGQLLPNYVYKNGANHQRYVSAMIKVNAGIQTQQLDLYGVKIGTKAGNIWTAQIPVQNVKAFTTIQGIDYIQLDEPIVPNLDSVRRVTHVDSVQAGYGLPMPYNGEGVVVGAVDGGFDYTHPELFDTTGVGFRVKKLWEQEDTSGTPPAGFVYGTERTDSTSMWTRGTDGYGSHGTHTTGIAAGSGFGSPDNKQYRGVAYKSDLVIVSISPDSSQWVNTGQSDIIDGINYVYTYAASVNKPAVINLSWGAPLGPRDGTSLFSTALDNLTGAGKIFVCSVSNNGTDNIHLQKTFTLTDTVVKTFVNIATTPAGKRTWIDVWGDSGKNFCLQVGMYSRSGVLDSTGYICLDNTTHNAYLLGINGDTCFIGITTSTSEFNHNPRIFLSLYSKKADSLMIAVKGTSGKINMWDSYVYGGGGFYSPFTSLGQAWAVNGDANITISDIGASKSAIAVGAYVSKLAWVDVSGQPLHYTGYTIGNLAPFSSLGPTGDGRVKPDITAPGLTVTSGGSSFDGGLISGGGDYDLVVDIYHNPKNNRMYPFVTYAGTSMASPVVAGVVGLMLQVTPNLTPQNVKDILAETAIKDKYTGVIPTGGLNNWGNGKVNAYQAVKKTIALTGIKTVESSGNNNFDVYPNPTNGNFTLDYFAGKEEKVTLKIYNLLGDVVATDVWQVNEGYNNKSYNFTNLSKGVYFVKLGSSVKKLVVE